MILEELSKCQQRESVEKGRSVEDDGLNVEYVTKKVYLKLNLNL